MDISGNASWRADSVNSFHCSVGRHPQMPVPRDRPSLGWTQNCSLPKPPGVEVVGRRCDYSGLLLQLFCAWGLCLFACSEFRSTISAHVHSVRVTEVFQQFLSLDLRGKKRPGLGSRHVAVFLACGKHSCSVVWPTRMKHPCGHQILASPPPTHVSLRYSFTGLHRLTRATSTFGSSALCQPLGYRWGYKVFALNGSYLLEEGEAINICLNFSWCHGRKK